MKRRTVWIVAGVVVLGLGWALFRPELVFVNRTVSEAFPAASAAPTGGAETLALVHGSFHGVAHETSGAATIHRFPDGSRVLRLTNFKTSNGPDVRVFLVAAADAADNDTVKNAGYVELGKLKGNVGDQNYDVPADVDLARYRAVTIWCNRFGVNFATAPLKSAPA
jgi:hypothetical protein